MILCPEHSNKQQKRNTNHFKTKKNNNTNKSKTNTHQNLYTNGNNQPSLDPTGEQRNQSKKYKQKRRKRPFICKNA